MGSSGLIKKKPVDYTFKSRALCLGLCLLFLWMLCVVVYFSISLFPETEMVLYSKCYNPLQNWDGKILNIQVWSNSYRSNPSHFNLYRENSLPSDFDKAENLNEVNDRVVVLWGTHHKTGTFLAKKLFAKVCAKLKWCCLFHVTRDSVYSVRHALHTEPVNALGHNQWIWHPKELNITKYRFIHFYRSPFRKIVSGYHYHADGTEPWTSKPQEYAKLCHHANQLSHTTVNSVGQKIATHHIDHLVNRSTVFNYCHSVHLCETCCRKAHEMPAPNNAIVAMSETEKKFISRPHKEYQIMCKLLGNVTKSVQHSLLNEREDKAIKIEAALEYYEILRMATLYNQTINDSNTLNLDLDELTEHYEETTWKILRHIKDLIPSTELDSLHKALGFYNLETSPLYRWSMSNPIINHVTSGKDTGGLNTSELVQVLREDPEVMALYGPILSLMGQG